MDKILSISYFKSKIILKTLISGWYCRIGVDQLHIQMTNLQILAQTSIKVIPIFNSWQYLYIHSFCSKTIVIHNISMINSKVPDFNHFSK